MSTLNSLSRAYISIPTRPPDEKGITGPSSKTLAMCYQDFDDRLAKDTQVEYLTGYEGDAFSFSGDVEQDLLSITAVHPMRRSAVKRLLKHASDGNGDWKIVNRLIKAEKLLEVEYNNVKYYIRRATPEKV